MSKFIPLLIFFPLACSPKKYDTTLNDFRIQILELEDKGEQFMPKKIKNYSYDGKYYMFHKDGKVIFVREDLKVYKMYRE